MRYEQYVAIREAVQQGQSPAQIAEAHPDVLYDSLVSIWSSWWQAHQSEALKLLRRRSGAAKMEVAKRFVSGDSLVSLARSRSLSPLALARELLGEAGWSRAAVKELIRDPDAIVRVAREGTVQRSSPVEPSSAASFSLSPPTLLSPTAASASLSSPPPPTTAASPSPLSALLSSVSLLRWRDELQRCLEQDEHGSPFLDSIKHLTGQHYESLLASHLGAHNIPFITESALRSGGLASKTPDFLLPVPIVVHGVALHWLDSKALFADGPSQRAHVASQLRKYVNRHSSGAVIYWMGFVQGEPGEESVPVPLAQRSDSGTGVESLSQAATVDNGQILLLSDFPASFLSMRQLMEREAQAMGIGRARNGDAPAATPAPQAGLKEVVAAEL